VLEHHYADVLLKLDRVDDAIEPAQASVRRYKAHPDWTPAEASHARKVLTFPHDDPRFIEILNRIGLPH
jgi:hypothetical protein